jgi:hypothetical protein
VGGRKERGGGIYTTFFNPRYKIKMNFNTASTIKINKVGIYQFDSRDKMRMQRRSVFEGRIIEGRSACGIY